MLPQMMPLPWLMVFLFIFICVYSVSLYFSFFSFDNSAYTKNFKSNSNPLPW
uniref:ATP synthase F0 subunit 8 n=1 Tax=Tyrophagus longior TaxID=223634 RepID=A0A0S2SXD9_TYRLO|nr:ATP synthase F0 subunit 8 [Tyrophagus longior]ALP46616.1 ATP synthase F0 subunit 8 [Tyrophagus longior]